MITNCNIIYKAFEKKYVAFNSVIAYQFDRDFLFSTLMKKCYQPRATLCNLRRKTPSLDQQLHHLYLLWKPK
jgi:hypothetical protein